MTVQVLSTCTTGTGAGTGALGGALCPFFFRVKIRVTGRAIMSTAMPSMQTHRAPVSPLLLLTGVSGSTSGSYVSAI